VNDSVVQAVVAVAADGGCGRKKEGEENLHGVRTGSCDGRFATGEDLGS
jgi:hypothetical protein